MSVDVDTWRLDVECRCCGCWAPDDPETGYSDAGPCPSCSADGFAVTHTGEIINERLGPCEVCAESADDYCSVCGWDCPSCLCQPKAAVPVDAFDQVRRG